MKNERIDILVDPCRLDMQQCHIVVSCRNGLVERTFEPGESTRQENGTTVARHGIHPSEAITGLGGYLAANLLMSGCEDREAQAGTVLEKRPRRRSVLHANRHQRRTQ